MIGLVGVYADLSPQPRGDDFLHPAPSFGLLRLPAPFFCRFGPLFLTRYTRSGPQLQKLALIDPIHRGRRARDAATCGEQKEREENGMSGTAHGLPPAVSGAACVAEPRVRVKKNLALSPGLVRAAGDMGGGGQ